MPDVTGCHDRAENLKRAMESPSNKKGGIFSNRNGKLWTVNIRPSKWNDQNKPSKFWIGKQYHEEARYLADAILHYQGKPRFHFCGKDADNLTFPILECIGTQIGTPVRLTSQAIRSNYVQSIAGPGYEVQRQDFIDKVKNVIESRDFLLQRERFLRFREDAAAPSEGAANFNEEATRPKEDATAPSEEAAIVNEATRPKEDAAAPSEEAAIFNEEATIHKMETTRPKEDAATPKETAVPAEDYSEETSPIEDDAVGRQALQQCQLGFSEAHYMYAASFELDFNVPGETSLQSAGQSFDLTRFSMKDCPTTLKEVLNADKEELQGWMETVAKLNTNSYVKHQLCNDTPDFECDFGDNDCNWMEGFGSDHLELFPPLINTTENVSANPQQLNNAKRQKIGDGRLKLAE